MLALLCQRGWWWDLLCVCVWNGRCLNGVRFWLLWHDTCECGTVLGRWRDTTRQLNDKPKFLVCWSSHGFVPRIPLAQAAFCCNQLVRWDVHTLKLSALCSIAELDWVWFLFAVTDGPKDFGGSHQLLLPIRWGTVIWSCKWLLLLCFIGGTLVELIPCLSCRCCKFDSSCSPKLRCQVHASWDDACSF